MSQEPKSNAKDAWRPTATLTTLEQRAKILCTVRAFFDQRGVLEVETPCLSDYTVTDPYLSSLTCQVNAQTNYLQTSPEYFMKRLLAAGSGSIYQIAKAFRADEKGRLHNPEFTMLEWYRVGFDHHQLMDELDALVQKILGTAPAERLTYQSAFQQYLSIDPLAASTTILQDKAVVLGVADADLYEDKDDWLMLLFSQCIEPQLLQPTLVYDFPASQSALAKISEARA